VFINGEFKGMGAYRDLETPQKLSSLPRFKSCSSKSKQIVLSRLEFVWCIFLHRKLIFFFYLGSSQRRRFQFFWVVTPCNIVTGYQHYGGPCCLHNYCIVLFVFCIQSVHRRLRDRRPEFNSRKGE